MKTFNPLIEMGWKPLIEDAEYNRQMKLIEESEFLCDIVDTAVKLLDEVSLDDNYTQLWIKKQTPLESAFDMFNEERKGLGYKHQIFNEEVMKKMAELPDINKYMITLVYLAELKQIAVYRDIVTEGNPDTKEKREVLENIKDKHRYIMIDEFKSLKKSDLLTLTEILFHTFNYMLNVSIEFEKHLSINPK